MRSEESKAFMEYQKKKVVGCSWYHEKLDHSQRALAGPFHMHDYLMHLEPPNEFFRITGRFRGL